MNVLKFRVEIEQLEDKLWRVFEISEKRTLAEFVCFILSSYELVCEKRLQSYSFK
ncbi:MAG: hypothetical protein IJ809_07440 [Clostridia bacterium]|nr:hypothetical protein [Clostridia bacterium]